MKSVQAKDRPLVLVIDDDESVALGLGDLFRSVGLDVETFLSADEFLRHELPDVPSCIVLDVRLPGLSGLDFQAELTKAGFEIPIVFMTGHGDIPMSVKAMKAGAFEFLIKPFREQDMLDAVQAALVADEERREEMKPVAVLKANYDTLTPREREVMALVTAGLMNKQIAGELNLSEVTVKVHRGNLTRKMQARSLADLIRMADILGLQQQQKT